MPLKRLTLCWKNEKGKIEYNKHPCTLTTIGPAKEEWGQEIVQVVHDFWTSKGVVWDMAPRVKFETSADGYPHFHLGERSTRRKPTGVVGMLNLLKKHMLKYKDDKPPGYDPEKGYSIAIYQVPISETISSKVLRGSALINAYLDHPTKEKPTEGGNFVMEIADYDPDAHVRELRQDFDDSLGCLYEAGRAKRRYDDASAWLRKYRIRARKEPLMPIDHFIMGNLPPLDQITVERAKRICPNHPFFRQEKT